MNLDVLTWKWGTPEAVIVLRAGAVVRWEHCLAAAPPSEAEYAAAAAEYAALQSGSAPLSHPSLAAQAAALWASPDVPEAVAAVLARVQAVAALGVDIADWSFQGVTAAAEAAMGTGDKLATLTASVALRTAWDRLVYHAGDMRTADRLWPYLYDIAMKP
jgi:hypothetical protein